MVSRKLVKSFFGPCVQDLDSIDILGRLHSVGKLKAGFNHLPGGLFQLGSVMTARPILLFEKWREPDHVLAWSRMTEPTCRSGELSDEKTCSTRERRLISLLSRSRTLLVRRRFQCDGGKSRQASASGSASSSAFARLGQQPSSISHATIWILNQTILKAER